MERFDNHIHLRTHEIVPQQLLSQLEAAGIHGANVFSLSPKEITAFDLVKDYEERITHVLRFCKGYTDRLFPILWVHPDEDGILSKVDDAVSRGIFGFKIICNNFYAYEDKSLRLLERIAATGKPVIFHSGILWDGTVSSAYNKPVNWECCLEIPHLKFALAHCSWPWHDECIAMYGKFLNAMNKRSDISAEMFIDITPGTPPIYRKELLYKLSCIGYDIEHNLLFGTDCRADDYNIEWSSQCQKRDDALYDELGIGQETRALIYGGNLKRFLGLSNEVVQHRAQNADGRVQTH